MGKWRFGIAAAAFCLSPIEGAQAATPDPAKVHSQIVAYCDSADPNAMLACLVEQSGAAYDIDADLLRTPEKAGSVDICLAIQPPGNRGIDLKALSECLTSPSGSERVELDGREAYVQASVAVWDLGNVEKAVRGEFSGKRGYEGLGSTPLAASGKVPPWLVQDGLIVSESGLVSVTAAADGFSVVFSDVGQATCVRLAATDFGAQVRSLSVGGQAVLKDDWAASCRSPMNEMEWFFN